MRLRQVAILNGIRVPDCDSLVTGAARSAPELLGLLVTGETGVVIGREDTLVKVKGGWMEVPAKRKNSEKK